MEFLGTNLTKYTQDLAFQVVLVVKNLPANAGDVRDMGLIPGSGRSLEVDMAAHSSILVWRIPWTEETWGEQLQYSPQGHKELDMTQATEHVRTYKEQYWCI